MSTISTRCFLGAVHPAVEGLMTFGSIGQWATADEAVAASVDFREHALEEDAALRAGRADARAERLAELYAEAETQSAAVEDAASPKETARAQGPLDQLRRQIEFLEAEDEVDRAPMVFVVVEDARRIVQEIQS